MISKNNNYQSNCKFHPDSSRSALQVLFGQRCLQTLLFVSIHKRKEQLAKSHNVNNILRLYHADITKGPFEI